MTRAEHLRDWALHLAGNGWPVFPLIPGTKRPAIEKWQHRASTDTERITRCWASGAFNIGVATGPAGLIVLDLDTAPDGGTDDGAAGLAAVAAERGGPVPETYTVDTPSLGRHLYYAAPAGTRLRNTASRIAPHVDTRAAGGYVVGPGSVLPNGGYELASECPCAELPGWLVQVLAERPATANTAPPEKPVTNKPAYGSAGLSAEAQRVRTAPRGHHNEVLSNAAYNVGQLIGAGALSHNSARAVLVDAAAQLVTAECSCTETECARVIDAAITKGFYTPRRPTGRAA